MRLYLVASAASDFLRYVPNMELEGLEYHIDDPVWIKIEMVDNILHALVERLGPRLKLLDLQLVQQSDEFGVAFVLLTEQIILLLLVEVASLKESIASLVVVQIWHADPHALSLAWL